MEVQNSEHSHIIEVCGDVPTVERRLDGSKFCGTTSCGFSDAKTSSKDAKERSASMRKLLMAVVLYIISMSVEVVGGTKANSLAILTDAAHLLPDVAAFAISLFSIWASGWEATPRQSYGFFRIEILGALVSIQLTWLLAGILVYEAVARLIHDSGEVEGFLMFVVSAFVLVVNVAMALLFGHDRGHGNGHGHGHSHGHGDHDHDHGHAGYDNRHRNRGLRHETRKDTLEFGSSVHTHHQHHHGGNSKHNYHHNLEADATEPLLSTYSEDANKVKAGPEEKQQRNINVQGAYLRVLGDPDSIQSVGLMIGGAIIWFKPDWGEIIDLICTLIISAIVLGTTIRRLRSILEVLMESTPREIDATRLEMGLCEMDEVVAIHELHIWAITVGKVLLACHVKIKPEADADMVLDKVINYIRREYNISHVTIQIERQ